MDEQFQTLEDYLAILKRRKWQLIVPAVLLSILALLAALLIPPMYRSSATILIERQEIPSELVQTTVTGFADQRIQVISQRVMTTSNLSGLIERYDLYQDIRRKESINMAVEEMRKRIKLNMISADVLDPRSGRPQEATIAFSLSFEDGSPTLAQKITSDLVSLFLNENLEQRTAAANEATVFLQTEADRLGQEIGTLEARLAAFKEQNSDNLPELAAINREQMLRTEERLRDNTQSTRTLEQQALYLESELAQIDPAMSTAQQPSSVAAHLDELEAQYVRVKERYSPQHPDRIQLEREIASLRSLVGQTSAAPMQNRLTELKAELAALRKRYSDDHPDVVALKRSIAATETQIASARRSGEGRQGFMDGANNPAYVQLRARLEGARLEIDSLKEARVQLEQELARYEARVTAGPKIEQEYRALTRDYDNAMSKYREIREKGLQAQLAQSLETSRKGERFSLIEPPLLPEKPFKPNRLAIVVLGLVLAVAGGVGNLALRESLDKGLHGARAIRLSTTAPLLAIIPYINTRDDHRRRVKRLSLLIGGSFAALVGMALAVHFLFMPLDVLWFTLMRRLDRALPMLSECSQSGYWGLFIWNA
ncbi:Wzz/FepE/Etk N-terminal domain-containing protein [Thiobaca trueperi]|uniref:Uncharacterized protein involved in exopolysaccharide biosynthesis n=1 Tax=Thiobaca trueperi TaxID=127458 RepID=A0A4R3MYP1_9GAMM|nr:Wzz/FepE/Etk N-terminal domain-containing protein [Thiobaca trueperi]TCT21504.1 uncharacterized protein involved in exopolysaccharide biosynthesis [Thiobaca trueperi]